MDARAAAREYVISAPRGHGALGRAQPVPALLAGYDEVEVVRALGDSVVLARMPEAARQRILQDHPELIIEPNLRYRHFEK